MTDSDDNKTSQVSIQDAQANLSQWVDRAAKGHSVVIARAGKPLARMVGLSGSKKTRRLGFMKGEMKVPDDFDDMGAEEISNLFTGKE